MVIVWNEINFGLLLEGRQWADRLMAFGRERQDPRALGTALWLLGWLAIIAQDYEAALAYGEECLRIAFTPLDRQFGETVVGNSQLLLGRTTEGVETLLRHRQRAQARGWRFSALSTSIPLAVSALLRGEFATGVHSMESVIERAEAEYNYRVYANFARIYLAEFYVALVCGTRKPTLLTLLKNLTFLIRVKRGAAGSAEKLLRQAMAEPCFIERGLNRARIEFDLGELFCRDQPDRSCKTSLREGAYDRSSSKCPKIARQDRRGCRPPRNRVVTHAAKLFIRTVPTG
jgi:hypothetical protein